MSPALLFVFTSLAAHRAVRLAVEDDFPPIVWIREHLEILVARRWGEDWASGISCPWCAGFWISEAIVLLVWHWARLPLPGLWFAAVPSVVGSLSTALIAMEG